MKHTQHTPDGFTVLLEALKDIQRSLNFSTNGGTSRNKFECELLKVANEAIAKVGWQSC